MSDTIYIASDHAGFELKELIRRYLEKEKFRVRDDGPFSYDQNDDYPDYAEKVCKDVLRDEARGILICSTGQGMDRTANKIPGIYASVAWSEETAIVAKRHGDVNVLCLAGAITPPDIAKRIVDVWISTPFADDGRHARRVAKLKEIERKYMN